jgi:hypothetical protein
MINGPAGQFLPPSPAEVVKRLQMAIVLIATEIDEPSGRSVEEQVERILYPEHFPIKEC